VASLVAARGSEISMNLPPLRAHGVEIKQIEDKRTELNQNRRERRMAEVQLRQLEASVEQARMQDTQAAVRARRENRKDPGPRHENKLRAQIEKLTREVSVLEGLGAELEAEARDLMRDHAQQITEALRANLGRINEAQLGALSQLENARSQRQELLRTLGHVDAFVPVEAVEDQGPGRDYTELGGIHGTKSIRQMDDHDVMRVLAQLRAEAGDVAELETMAAQEQPVVDIYFPGASGLPKPAGRIAFEQRRAERETERVGAE
jgi:hypothetical protein